MSLTDAKNLMVYIETADGEPINNALEVLAKAKDIAQEKGEEVCAVLIGSGLDAAADAVAKGGANKVIVVEKEGDYQAEAWGAILVELVKKYTPALVLGAASQQTIDVTNAVANAFEVVAATQALDIRVEGDDYVFTTPLYGGTVLNDVALEGLPKIATARSGAFKKLPEDQATAGEIVKETVDAQIELRTQLIEAVHEITDAVNLEEAEYVVCAGRGIGNKDNIAMCEQLAEVLGGVVGGTRPVVEDDWLPRPRQVGQSGKIIAPKVYIGCGVSGATQHVSGITAADFILAINKDEDAPIFEVADAGIVGDVNEVVPLLIEEFKKLKQG